jgi:acyl-CoA synthetase (AMP-forming)/AMP-acid ligase II
VRTLVELLDHLDDDRGTTQLTFPETGERLAHREIPSRAWGVAASLARLGVTEGVTVGLLIGSVPEFLPAAFGVWASGGAIAVVPVPPMPVAADVVAAGLVPLLNGLHHLVVAEAHLDTARALQALRPDLTVLAVSDCAPTTARPALPAVPPESPAIVQFTSGSTARPKGVVLSHRAVLACFAATATASTVGPADVVVSWVPLFHDFGLITLLFGVWQGYEHHLVSAWRFIRHPRRVVEYVSTVGATVFGGPDFAYDRIAAAYGDGLLEGLDLRSWRLALNGGEPVKPATVTKLAQALGPAGFPGTAMLPVYGMAEATMSVACPRPGLAPKVLWLDRESLAQHRRAAIVPPGADHGTALVSVGQAVPNMDLRICDENGRAVAESDVGEILLRGPSLADRYFGDPETTAPLLRDGWLHTGDLGVRLDGALYIAGRAKDMIIVAGRNFFAEDVEDVVRGGMRESRGRCVAVADPDRERVVVVVESDDPANAQDLSSRLRSLVSSRLDLGAIDVHVVPRNTLPRTTSGKWQRGLTARYLRELSSL